ncbi:MAG: hypothetical protein ABJA49_00470 [Betaproteobacteria bacterium]
MGRAGLVDRFRSMFPNAFRYEGNRAIVFAPADKIDTRSLKTPPSAHDRLKQPARYAL